MTDVFPELDRVSGLFEQGAYQEAIPIFRTLRDRDPNNPILAVRYAVALSLTGAIARADAQFRSARELAPGSSDVMHYEALHLLRSGRPDQAQVLLEAVLEKTPRRGAALQALASLRERNGDLEGAAELLARYSEVSGTPPKLMLRLGSLHMASGNTQAAIQAFESARTGLGDREFPAMLELGVLYLADQQVPEAAACFDAVPPRTQATRWHFLNALRRVCFSVSQDRAQRIALARQHADASTQSLIAQERLFQGL